MSDVKTEYSELVVSQNNNALTNEEIADAIKKGRERKAKYGAGWETVDINEVVAEIAPGAKPIVKGSKIFFFSLDGTKVVVADVSGYLRVQDLTKKTKKRQYLDSKGKDAHNFTDSNGKKRGRSKEEFQRATHFIIKKRKVR